MLHANEKTIAVLNIVWRGEAATGTGHAVSRALRSAKRSVAGSDTSAYENVRAVIVRRQVCNNVLRKAVCNVVCDIAR
jgi:hypothetical protein